MLFYLFSNGNLPIGSSPTQKIYDLYDIQGLHWGHVIQAVSKICSASKPTLVTVSSLLVIDGLGQLSLVYQAKPWVGDQVCGLLSPGGQVVSVQITTSVAKITTWVGTSLTNPLRCPLRAYLPYDPLLTVKKDFYTILRFYRYTLSPNLVGTVLPVVESQETGVAPEPMIVQFNYFSWLASAHTKGGPVSFGHDQYATYWNYPDEAVGDFLASRVVLADVSHTNYFSLRYGNPSQRLPDLPLPQSLPYGYTDVDPSIDFFIDCWSLPRSMSFPNPFTTDPSGPIPPVPTFPVQEQSLTGNVNVYRLDRQTSAFIEGDDYKPGTCLASYLFSLVTEIKSFTPDACSSSLVLHPYGLLQMRIPVSCFDNNQYYSGCTAETIDLQYWSVGSHICLDQADRFLPFWTVNAQMMHDLGQEYGYVVWAPYEDVVPLVEPGSTSPPVITIGKDKNIKAYVLQTPTLAFIFRYRQVSAEWPGNPVRAPCLDTFPETIQSGAITSEMVGPDGVQWCPQLLADDTATTWQEFMQFLDTVV